MIDLTDQHHDGNYPITSTIGPLLDNVERVTQHLDTYIQFKGRGRYKLTPCVTPQTQDPALSDPHPRSKSKTVNAEFEINPDANDGLNYVYDAVVRNKEERRRMHGSDCECCKEVSFFFFHPQSTLDNSMS